MPTIICRGFQSSSCMRRAGAHQCASATSTTATTAASARRCAALSRSSGATRGADSHSATTSGMAHTQWCVQAIGEATTTASEATKKPSTRSPWRVSQAPTATMATDTTPPTSSQASVAASVSGPNQRLMKPITDWLPRYSLGIEWAMASLMWLGSPPADAGSVSSQKARAVPGVTTNETPMVATKVPVATAAARHWRVRSSQARKVSGESLMPAAMPRPTPRHQRSRPVARSAVMRAARMRLTCPKCMVSHTGSATMAATSITVATTTPTPARPSATCSRKATQAIETSRVRAEPNHGLTQAIGRKASSANGG
ncbi:hypothetical protein BJF82_04400 [Kytococcus sp. CUA-901]|nr:hypothetical protein BJF82_04400 [Kytococcus sp. CUA-901]